jgi:putative ubiquitin-RnfH superfamily antitoxin RatB of RatAB toxin-antitoxin module
MQIHVAVMYSPGPRQLVEKHLELVTGASVMEAIRLSGLLVQFPGIDINKAVVGIWGRKVSLEQPLKDQDRVEIYRPLTVDPKVARRKRFVGQGVKSAGLFAKRRSGAKAGY